METYAPCFKCGVANAEKVNFSWWGGVLGPKLLKHVKCRNCGNKYNGKTGQSNTTGIILYSVIVGGLSLFLVIAAIAVFFISQM